MGMHIKALDDYRKEVITMSRSKPFGVLLREARESRELAQSDVARIAGINRVSVNKYERGKMKPKFTTAKMLLEAVGVEIQDVDLMKSLTATETEFTEDELSLIRAYRTSKTTGDLDKFWNVVERLV